MNLISIIINLYNIVMLLDLCKIKKSLLKSKLCMESVISKYVKLIIELHCVWM